MEKIALRATRILIISNIFLFFIKIYAGLTVNSLAIISDALNSFLDIIASTAIWFAVKISYKEADWNHPFGHSRAQPIAGLIVAILTCILSFEIAQTAILNLLYSNHQHQFAIIPVVILLITILTKLGLMFFLQKIGRGINSPAIRASVIDSWNDVMVSTIALIGFLIAVHRFPEFDDIAALLIAGFIIYSGYLIGKENLDYLMGCIPSSEIVADIKKLVLSVNGVLDFNEIRAHYVGNFVHVEIHIDVADELTVKEAHDIGVNVQRRVEELHIIDRAFVHIDPIDVAGGD